jgi:hypothetical protein
MTWFPTLISFGCILDHLESLETITEDQLSENWMSALLDLREIEGKLFGTYSSTQQEFIEVVNRVVSVGSYIADHPCEFTD